MRCSSNCAWTRWWSVSDESLNQNAECACACGTQAEGSTVRSAVAVGDEMAGKALAVCEQDSTAAADDSTASPGD